MLPVGRISIDQYHEMVRNGILTTDDRVELLDGQLVAKPRRTPKSRFMSRLTDDALTACAPEGWFVWRHPSITLADSEPEPDLAIVRGPVTDYVHRHPGASEVALVVEASDLAINFARTLKKQIFAAAGIPIYWILNVVDEQLEVFENPSGNAETAEYRASRILKRGERATVQIGDAIVGPIPIEAMLP